MAAIQPVPDINPALPDFPGPNIPESQYDDQAYVWGTAIPGYGNRIYTIGNNVYNNAQVAIEQANAAIAARDRAETVTVNALSAMNFKGDWSTLSGPLARPATVQHNSSVWLLMRDVANVAVEVPGVSTAWINQTARVSSVMGRTGDVVGLVETNVGDVRGKSQSMADAPIGQPVIYEDSTGAGADWPTAYAVSSWLVGTTGSANRRMQVATQMLSGVQYGFQFVRTKHDAAWTRWMRVLNDGSPNEKFVGESVGATFTPDLTKGTIFWVEPNATNVTITMPTPRDGGQPCTLRLVQRGSNAFLFGANVKLPLGSTLPAIGVNEMLTVTLMPMFDTQNMWTLFVGGKHAA